MLPGVKHIADDFLETDIVFHLGKHDRTVAHPTVGAHPLAPSAVTVGLKSNAPMSVLDELLSKGPE
jgi:hypothetical protein